MPFRARRVIWSLRGRDWSVRGRGSQGEGGIETPLPLSGFLVTFAPWQKSLAAGAAKHPHEINIRGPRVQMRRAGLGPAPTKICAMQGRALRTPGRRAPRKTHPVGRGLAPAVVLHCILGDFVGAAPRGRPQVHSVCPPRHSEAPEGPWESVFPGRGMRIAASGLRPSSQ